MSSTKSALLMTLACCLMLSSVLVVQSVSATSTQRDQGVNGYWKSLDKDTGKPQSIFELYEEQGKLNGKIVKVFPKLGEKYDPICRECPGAQKNQPKIGLVFFHSFVRSKDKPRKWIDGKLLNPENGKTYGAEVELSPDGSQLSVYGYIRILFKIGGTNVWVRPTEDELQNL
jgi:uncharacterized protein (DUF2147 family)